MSASDVRPRHVRLLAFDLDGVVWRGGELLPHVRGALEDVVRRGLLLRYVSNNSTAHRRTVSERLAGLDLPAGTERVLTSGFVSARWLRARLPAGAPVMVVGESGLLAELSEAGLDAYHAGERGSSRLSLPPAAVVVGMDRGVDFDMLTAAQAAIRAGALFVATNRDATFPTPTGEIPGAGAIVAAVATAAETEPVLMGKPGLGMAEVLALTTGVAAEQTLFVGDRISTDVAMGAAAGMTTLLVLTGVTTPEQWRRIQQDSGARALPGEGASSGVLRDHVLPDHVLPDLSGLPALLDRLTA